MILLKIINIVVYICEKGNQFINNYINYISLEVNKDEKDVFEKFFYNSIILIHWLLVNLNITIIKISKHIFSQSMIIKNKIEDHLQRHKKQIE